jgi:hypothetical protein
MSVMVKDAPVTAGKVLFNIHIQADLNVSAFMAKRMVTGYLIDHVSDHLGGTDPFLLVEGERFLWRVPVWLYLTSRGKVGQVGEIDVDGQTGQLLITQSLLEEIKAHAEYFATRSTS